MRDFVNLKIRDVEPGKKNLSECRDDSEDSGKSLLVKVEATHSGIINGNQRFYRPDRMQDSVYRWTEPGKPLKPVLVEHEKEGQVIGRVHTARYIDLSYLYRDSIPEIGNMLFYADATTKRLDLFRSINMVLDKLQPLDDYKGLGYIELGMKITNPDGIRKVLAGEYLTVSVGFQTDQAICSACHTDWATDDRCEHKLGEMVDGKKMFLIAGNFFYKECSFVNFPADPFAQVISKELLKDSLQNKMFFMGLRQERQAKVLAACEMTDSLDLGKMYESDIQVADPTDIKENEMLVELQSYLDEMNKAPLTKEHAVEISDKIKALEPKEEAEKEMVRRVKTTLKSHIQKHGLSTVADKKITKEQVEAKIEALIPTLQDMTPEARDHYLARIAEEAKEFELEVPQIDTTTLQPYQDWKVEDLPEDERSFFADPEALYEQMFTKADSEDAIKAEDAEYGEVLVDAKLSTEKRKSLKGSAFCGPGRSFPVPDCAHVTAARRLIGRAKVGSATKSKILSCVSRKASAMGCESKKKDADATPVLTDAVKTLLAELHKVEIFSFDDAKIPADTLTHLDTLNGHYKAADDQGKGAMRYCLYANLGHWQSISDRCYAMDRLKEIEEGTENKDALTEIVLTDAEKKAPLMLVGAGLKTEMGKGFVPKGASSSYEALHKAHSAADSEGKSHIVSAAGALLETWHSGSLLEYHRKLLAPGTGQSVKDMIILTNEEHDTLLVGQEKLEGQLAAVRAELDALQQQNTILVKSLKKDRATTLVAMKVLTGEAGFQGLSDADLQTKVTEREQRSLASLRDALDDELAKLSGFTFQGGTSTTKPGEAGVKTIADNAKLNPDGATNVTDNKDSKNDPPARKLPRDPKAAKSVLFFENKIKDLKPAPKE
jgi:hypothetical protein